MSTHEMTNPLKDPAFVRLRATMPAATDQELLAYARSIGLIQSATTRTTPRSAVSTGDAADVFGAPIDLIISIERDTR